MAHPPSDLPPRYGGRFFTEGVPDNEFPKEGMRAVDAYQLLEEGDGPRWRPGAEPRHVRDHLDGAAGEEGRHREPPPQLHRPCRVPADGRVEQRCIRMLADLYNAPGETTGCRTQGSSEAVMLGALAAKWRWRKAREAAGLSTDRPNLVYAEDVTIMRALVKENVGHAGANTLVDDIERACALLDKRGVGLPDHARARVKREPGY